MRPSKALPAPVHIHVQIDRLPDTQLGKLSLLEIGIDPDIGQRAQRHELFAGDDVIARIDVAARHHAVDVRHHVAISQIKLGLVKIGLGLTQFGLRLLDVGSIAQDLIEDDIDIA